MTCVVCGHTEFRPETVRRVFTVEDRIIRVDNIPAEVCKRCGAASFSAETAEQVRRLVHESARPIRIVNAEVVEYPRG